MHDRRSLTARLMPFGVVLAVLMLFTGCGSDRDKEDDHNDDDRGSDTSPGTNGFTGQFTGSFPDSFRGRGQSIPIRMTLRQDGESVTGQYYAVYPFTVDARATGPSSITGTLTPPTYAMTHPPLQAYTFTGRLVDGTLRMVCTPERPVPGFADAITFDLKPVPGQDTAAPDPSNGSLDPRLVGIWKSVATSGRRPLRPGIQTPRPTTEMLSRLNADGTFRFQTTTIQTHLPTGPTPGPVMSGRWKTENGTLFTQAAGTARWVPLGAYRLDGSGSAMSMTAPGTQQLWERVR